MLTMASCLRIGTDAGRADAVGTLLFYADIMAALLGLFGIILQYLRLESQWAAKSLPSIN